MKHFVEWIQLKIQLHAKSKGRSIEERDVFWCAFGQNVGHEINGKSQWFSRPALIVRKFNKHIAFAVPLSTRMKQNPYYVPITFQGKKQSVMISQLRVVDTGRFYKKLGVLDERDFYKVTKSIKKLFP